MKFLSDPLTLLGDSVGIVQRKIRQRYSSASIKGSELTIVAVEERFTFLVPNFLISSGTYLDEV